MHPFFVCRALKILPPAPRRSGADAKTLPPDRSDGSVLYTYFLVLHTVHGHCNHTCKISGTADSQNTQHFLFLHFESSTAFFAAIIVSLQSSLYAFPSEFQRFCTVHVFYIYIFCTISVPAHELQEAFPAIHPAFSRLHRARTILAGTPTSASKPRRILQDFHRVPPTASVQLHLALHFFGFFRHF